MNQARLKTQVESQLLQTVSTGGLTTYQKVGNAVGLEARSPILWGILGQLSEDYFESDGLLLSAIVVNSETGFPGKQFFDEIAKPRFCFKNKLEFWCGHVAEIHKRFKQ